MKRLADRIAQHGPIPFADFMEAALYDPEHGYYAAGKAMLGRGGDYFTNVSVGPLFGTLLMRQFAEMWRHLEKPARFDVVEQGAHQGLFARDVLEAAAALEPEFATALRYTIIEPFMRLRERQEETLIGHRVTWRDKLAPFTGVHFSNELIDAFPVHVVRREQGVWTERGVDFHEGRFVWTTIPLTVDVSHLSADLPDGYQTEVNAHAKSWLHDVAANLEHGWILAIDYGYLRPELCERPHGTLSGYAKHRRVDDLLASPGEIDLTAHVDFSSLIDAGVPVASFVDQHHFMAGLAPLHFHDSDPLAPARQKELRAFQTLMHPNMMGAAFKVITFARGVPASPPLSGFRFAGRS